MLTKSRWILTAMALGAFVIVNTFTFRGSVPYFRHLNGGLGILDILPFPDADRVHRALAGFGTVGRHDYAILLGTFDVLFPATATLFFAAWAGVLHPPRTARALRILAFATLGLDYLENLLCGALLATFPHEPAWLAALQGIVTALKFAGFLAGVVGLLAGIARRVRAPTGDRAPA